MKPSTIRAQPCDNLNCRGDHETAERVAMAVSLCGERGARLTELRRKVLELLWEHDRPVGAYELIEALKKAESRPVGPPTVYRALEFRPVKVWCRESKVAMPMYRVRIRNEDTIVSL